MRKAIILGGTAPHADLIVKLKEKGYFTILIDYLDNPPAANAADLHLRESTLDKEVVLKIAKENEVDLVISTCIDQANSIVCYVAEKLNLPRPYSYKTALDVTRKGQMKTIFKECSIPTSEFVILESKEYNFTDKLSFPLVVKPTDANSSKGVFRVEDKEEYLKKFDISLSYSREGKVIVEEFVPGIEIQVDCIVSKGKAYVLMTRDKMSMVCGDKELQVAGFSIPGEVCTSKVKEIQIIAQKIVDAFKLDNTPFFFQAICNEEGIFVLEFAPRIAGGTTYQMVEIYTGFDYLEAAINSFLNENIEVVVNENFLRYISKFLYMKPGVFGSIKGLENLSEKVYYFPFIKPGKEVNGSMNSGNRVAAIVASGIDYIAADLEIKNIMGKIEIVDPEGRNLNLE